MKTVSRRDKHEFTKWTFLDLDISLMKSPNIVLLFVQRHPDIALLHADISLRSNHSFVKQLCLDLKYHPAHSVRLPFHFQLKNTLPSIRKDVHCLFQYAAKISHADVLKYGSRAILAAFPALAANALSTNGALLQYLPDRLKDTKALALIAVQQCSYALQFVSARLRQDRQVVAMALNVRVPERQKFTFLMACMVSFKQNQLSRTLHSQSTHLSVQDKRMVDVLQCAENKHLLRSRNLLCKIGGIGRPLLTLIFAFAAWEPRLVRREVRDVLWNINVEIAKEWLYGEDVDELYMVYAQRMHTNHTHIDI